MSATIEKASSLRGDQRTAQVVALCLSGRPIVARWVRRVRVRHRGPGLPEGIRAGHRGVRRQSLVAARATGAPFFVVLSLVGALVVFGPADAAWLIGCGLLLIGTLSPARSVSACGWRCCYSPAGCWQRRAPARLPSAWSAAVWPILGSMFMFRLVLYMRAVRMKQAEGGLWGAAGLFLHAAEPGVSAVPGGRLPDVSSYLLRSAATSRSTSRACFGSRAAWCTCCFTGSFTRTSWAIRPTSRRLGDLAQLMLATFLLYLRVSGQFHLIVGMLHLFGFRLPETHNLYYLAHSFTELWRRINIYWKDFMMQVVFYPAYFKLKRLRSRALPWHGRRLPCSS